MTTTLAKKEAVTIEKKIHESNGPDGRLGIYQTHPFGLVLTMNDEVILSESDGFFYYEMMVHPAFFTHSHPKHIAIFGQHFGILPEVLKHHSVVKVHCINENMQFHKTLSEYFSTLYPEKNDDRVCIHETYPQNWISTAEKPDIILLDQIHVAKEEYEQYHQLLNKDGMLVQQCEASFLHHKKLKSVQQNLQAAGFSDWQFLNFPQPSACAGMRTILLATKQAFLQRIREKDVFNRPFTTRYYNFDVHKAALVLPEFMRTEFFK